MNPLISVVMPVKNEELFIGDAIRDILNQSYQNLELIIANDHSNDKTEEVVRQFKDPRIKWVEHQGDSSIAKARNTAIKSAIGEYIAIADADDRYHPKRLEWQLKHLLKNPTTDILGSQLNAIGGYPWTVYQQAGLLFAQLIINTPLPNSSIFFKRSLLDSSGLYNESFPKCEDYEFLIQRATVKNLYALNKPLITYRIRKKADDDLLINYARMCREKAINKLIPTLHLLPIHHKLCELQPGIKTTEYFHWHKTVMEHCTASIAPYISAVLEKQWLLYQLKNKLYHQGLWKEALKSPATLREKWSYLRQAFAIKSL